MSTRNNTIRTIGSLVVATLAVIVSTGAAIIPYSQGTSCEELEEFFGENDKFYCREYQSEDGDTKTVACGEDEGDVFNCGDVVKDGFAK